VFLALVPPAPLQEALGELARVAARRAHGRPVPAENIHLTLAFIGQWPTERMPLLLDVGAALRAAPLQLTLDTQGGFRRAGIAWIGPSAAPAALLQLATDLHEALSRAGITQDERAFHPHVTLARRCRGPYVHESLEPLAWLVERVALMQSDTRAEGARYRMVAQWTLASSAGTTAGSVAI
jgi:2'-5' RNA ligase